MFGIKQSYKFFLVLRRSEQDGVGLEDIDALQLELEALLSATVVRKMTLKEEIKILNNIEKYKGQGRSFKRVRELVFSST
jgi:transcriptional adapter 3